MWICALWNDWLFSGNGSRVLSCFLITTSTNTYNITPYQNNNALSTKYGTWLHSIMVQRLFVLQEYNVVVGIHSMQQKYKEKIQEVVVVWGGGVWYRVFVESTTRSNHCTQWSNISSCTSSCIFIAQTIIEEL